MGASDRERTAVLPGPTAVPDEKGTPAARPVRKADGSPLQETAGPLRRETVGQTTGTHSTRLLSL